MSVKEEAKSTQKGFRSATICRIYGDSLSSLDCDNGLHKRQAARVKVLPTPGGRDHLKISENEPFGPNDSITSMFLLFSHRLMKKQSVFDGFCQKGGKNEILRFECPLEQISQANNSLSLLPPFSAGSQGAFEHEACFHRLSRLGVGVPSIGHTRALLGVVE